MSPDDRRRFILGVSSIFKNLLHCKICTVTFPSEAITDNLNNKCKIHLHAKGPFEAIEIGVPFPALTSLFALFLASLFVFLC